MILFLRILSLLVWSWPFLAFAPAVYHTLRGDAVAGEDVRSAVWFTDLVIIGFNMRWVLFPMPAQYMESLAITLWSGLYVLSAVAGLLLTSTVRAARF